MTCHAEPAPRARPFAIGSRLCAGVCLIFLAHAATAEVILANGPTACTLRTSSYRLLVDAASPGIIAVQSPAGQPLLHGIAAFSVTVDGKPFEWTGAPAPHLHTLRAGPHLVEFAIENIVLKAGDETWPGLAELRATCQDTKIYLHLRFLLPPDDWVNAGRFVYRRPNGHPPASPCSPSDARMTMRAARQPVPSGDAFIIGTRPCLAVAATLPQGQAGLLSGDSDDLTLAVPVGETPWTPGAAREVACAVLIAPDRERATAALDIELHPLDSAAFPTSMGQCEGFDPRTGLYQFRAQTSPTPDPPRGLRAGSAFTVANDHHRRTILVESFDPWGGICGGMVRGADGTPLPIRIQFCLNFLELNAEAGEPGWASLTFPLSLAPRERRDLRVEHLYGGAADHDLLYLNSLENVGGPLLYQATVSRLESFTVTSGGELAINDFRRHYRDLKIRSVSAILPTFFGYYDAGDRYHGLVPGEARITEGGPFLADMTIAVRTADDAVAGHVRLWEVPCSDITRLFSDVVLRVQKDVLLSAKQPAPLFFLRHHAFNPMAYRRFAAWVAPGEARTGDLNFVPEVVANRMPLAHQPFGALYQASNGIDQGIPCSDITGNPGWVLLDADVHVAGKSLLLGVYVFATGANDAEHGDYARDLAVVPARRLDVLPAGSVITYRALQVVYGDNSSDYTPIAAERQAWAANPLRVNAIVGKVVSDNPPCIKADHDVVEFTLTGGTDWMALRVTGFTRPGRLEVHQTTADGAVTSPPRRTGDVAQPASAVSLPEEAGTAPDYTSWPDADGRFGFTFLVKLPPAGAALHLRASLSPAR